MENKKFSSKTLTANGENRAWVKLNTLKTLWFNTGTQCNLTCVNCYIESSPKNDRLVYLSKADVEPYLLEISELGLPVSLIGLTGGEPFLNPHIIEILETCLAKGFETLILTNAFRVLNKHKSDLLALQSKYQDKLHLRVSLDHYTKLGHEQQRGPKSFDGAIEGLKWLYDNGFNISIAARSILGENPQQALDSYQDLLSKNDIKLNLAVDDKVVIFPEMIDDENVPEITTSCWDILEKSPDDQMCASERMIVKRKGQGQTVVLPCTLIAYESKFELGHNLKDSQKDVYLNHVYCAKFCVLGGASCSSVK